MTHRYALRTSDGDDAGTHTSDARLGIDDEVEVDGTRWRVVGLLSGDVVIVEPPSPSRLFRLGAGSAAFAAFVIGVLLFKRALDERTGAGLFPALALVAAVGAAAFVVRWILPREDRRRPIATGVLVASLALLGGALLLVVLFIVVCSLDACFV